MSYAGPSRPSAESQRGARRSSSQGARSSRTASTVPTTPSYPDGQGETGWQEIALFGAGLALGVILGAGGALLTAPRTGAETRAALGARASRFRRSTARRSRNAWDELRDEIREAKRSLRNRKRRRQLEMED